ncbi:MAG: hypothetical protein GOV02_03730 [Candidatus Aenigmarchaeota archaeon]|nr:hypothetical protein [Candidatus Aenigmarchaeota archaeon]
MNLNILEEDKEKLKLELKGDTGTMTHLLAKRVWGEGGQAAAIREHPFMKEPAIVVVGNNPRKLLTKAATSIVANCDELKEEFRRALSK